MLGSCVVVAPLLAPNMTGRSVHLPRGSWTSCYAPRGSAREEIVLHSDGSLVFYVHAPSLEDETPCYRLVDHSDRGPCKLTQQALPECLQKNGLILELLILFVHILLYLNNSNS